MSTNVYWRHHNGNLGKIEAATNDHASAIEAVKDRLADEWKKPPHPVLAVVSKAREGWDG